jgi:hypothetical protein
MALASVCPDPETRDRLFLKLILGPEIEAREEVAMRARGSSPSETDQPLLQEPEDLVSPWCGSFRAMRR